MNPSIRTVALSVLAVLSPAVMAAQISSLSLPTNDILFDAQRGKIYASAPSTAGVGLGNTITTIDRHTLAIDRSVFIGSEPGKLALSDDGSVLYAGLDGAAAFRSYDTSTFTAGTQVALGADPFLGLYFVEDIEVMPGAPGTVAISRRNLGFSPRHEGVVIYDGTVRRAAETPGHTGSNVIEFSSDPSILFGLNNETTEFGLRTMSIDENGVQVIDVVGNAFSGFGLDFIFADGLLYSTSGRVIDAASRTLLGTFAASGPVAADADAGIVYFLEGFGSTRQLKLFDMETFVPLDTITIDGVFGIASSLILLDDRALAFRTSEHQLFIVNTVPVPAAAWMLLTAIPLLGFKARRARNGAS